MTASAFCEIQFREDTRFDSIRLFGNLAGQLADQRASLDTVVLLPNTRLDCQVQFQRAHPLREQIARAAFVVPALSLRDLSQDRLQPDFKADHLPSAGELLFIQLDRHLHPAFPAPFFNVKDATDPRGTTLHGLGSVEERDSILRQLWRRHR